MQYNWALFGFCPGHRGGFCRLTSLSDRSNRRCRTKNPLNNFNNIILKTIPFILVVYIILQSRMLLDSKTWTLDEECRTKRSNYASRMKCSLVPARTRPAQNNLYNLPPVHLFTLNMLNLHLRWVLSFPV